MCKGVQVLNEAKGFGSVAASCLTWILGIELWSSGKGYALNHPAISLAPPIFFSFSNFHFSFLLDPSGFIY